MKVISKDLNKTHGRTFRGIAWLVDAGKEVEIDDIKSRYFAISGADVMFYGWEVLVFPCDENGVVTSWGEVAGGRGVSHEWALEDLKRVIENGN